MESLSTIDYAIIAGLLVIISVIGLVMSRKAAKNLESYFLGGRNLPWYMLGVSGMSAWFDLTGTMIITSFLYLLGPRGLFIEFRGGAVLVLAFMMAYTGKWHRRSGCMTSAEWNTYRFGTGFSGELVRFFTALKGIILTIGMLAYLVRGATLFLGMMFPMDPLLLTVILLIIASVYTVLAGFYGMVLTDLFQGAILISVCIIISVIAWQQVPDAATLAHTAHTVLGNASWTESSLAWKATMPKGYEAYECLLMAAAFYLLRSTLLGLGSGTESRFFAARNSREASMQCLLQAFTVMFRWPLMISFAILGIFLVAKLIPDNRQTAQVAELIRLEQPDLKDAEWHTYTAKIAHQPERARPELVQKLHTALGDDWRSALLMIGPKGTVNPEVVLPSVLLHNIPAGLRGLMIGALIMALMGTLSGSVNWASSLFVRDIYQNFLRPKAKNRELITLAYLSSGMIVLVSFLMGVAAPSINNLWTWIIMSLTAGAFGPTVLRLYWWRVNAWGMAIGLFCGSTAAILQRIFFPDLSEWVQFPLITSISFGATILMSLATAQTPDKVVNHFYRTTRPFGLWGPFRRRLSHPEQTHVAREHRNDILSTVIALVWQVNLFMIPMQILTRNWTGVCCTGPIFILCSIGLYVFWWRNLPDKNEKSSEIDFTKGGTL